MPNPELEGPEAHRAVYAHPELQNLDVAARDLSRLVQADIDALCGPSSRMPEPYRELAREWMNDFTRQLDGAVQALTRSPGVLTPEEAVGVDRLAEALAESTTDPATLERASRELSASIDALRESVAQPLGPQAPDIQLARRVDETARIETLERAAGVARTAAALQEEVRVSARAERGLADARLVAAHVERMIGETQPRYAEFATKNEVGARVPQCSKFVRELAAEVFDYKTFRDRQAGGIDANNIVRTMSSDPSWRKLVGRDATDAERAAGLSEAQRLAGDGRLVIAGRDEGAKSGHVAIVLPGEEAKVQVAQAGISISTRLNIKGGFNTLDRVEVYVWEPPMDEERR